MRTARSFVVLFAFLCCAGVAHAGLDGSVFLMPINEYGFESHGEAVYVNALIQIDYSAELSGTHSVSGCEQSESCPLILDLNSDGIHTTGLDDPVHFWIDLQGRSEATAWTDPNTEEAFLWMDLDHDHVAQVTELFGSRMVGPNGAYYANGFDALLTFDRPEYGGDADGQITHRDSVWARLRLWVDRNHDAVSQPTEISVLSAQGIVALNLDHAEGDIYDEYGNELYLVGSYVARVHGRDTELRTMADVEFRYIPN